jgi:hypothetical protein
VGLFTPGRCWVSVPDGSVPWFLRLPKTNHPAIPSSRLTSSMQAMSGPSVEPTAPSELSPSPDQPRHKLPRQEEEPPMHFAPAPPISKAPTFTLPPPGSAAWQSVELPPPPPSPMQQSTASKAKSQRQTAAPATPTRVTRSSAAKRPEQEVIPNPFQSRGPRKDHGVV